MSSIKLEKLYKSQRHPFVWKEHLGWVVSSPAEVGTALKASITLRLQHLPSHKRLDNVLDRLRLQMIPTGTTPTFFTTAILFSAIGSWYRNDVIGWVSKCTRLLKCSCTLK